MAVSFQVSGGKKLAIALESIARKVVKGGALKMGFLEGARYPDVHPVRGTKQSPVSVAQVAFWNEFGTSRAPPRPFFRTTIAQESDTWGANLGKAIKYYEYDGAQALRALGQSMRDDLEASIMRWDAPPNAPSTVARKGFNKPLIDTGTMAKAPDFELTE